MEDHPGLHCRGSCGVRVKWGGPGNPGLEHTCTHTHTHIKACTHSTVSTYILLASFRLHFPLKACVMSVWTARVCVCVCAGAVLCGGLAGVYSVTAGWSVKHSS